MCIYFSNNKLIKAQKIKSSDLRAQIKMSVERTSIRVLLLLVLLLLSISMRARNFYNLFKRVAQNVFYGNISAKFDCFMSSSYNVQSVCLCACVHKTLLCKIGKSTVADRQTLAISAAYVCTRACLYLHVFVLGLCCRLLLSAFHRSGNT